MKNLLNKRISEALQISVNEIYDISEMKKGMTNHSFLFTYNNQKYIARVPGEGTEQLMNRKQEYDIYQALKNFAISDDIVYFSAQTGFKITKFITNTHTCDPINFDEVRKCMRFLRAFHDRNLKVNHTFDLYKQIEYYEALRNGITSCYSDYGETKRKIYELKTYIDKQPKHWTLSHIDAVPDNFLFYTNTDGIEEIRLIDWEYAGMQDAHVDIAMFAVYAGYNHEQVDLLISEYFPEGCSHAIRLKIYCYVAVCGFLWSNWCEFKKIKGVNFGDYALKQYQYALDYYDIFQYFRN